MWRLDVALIEIAQAMMLWLTTMQIVQLGKKILFSCLLLWLTNATYKSSNQVCQRNLLGSVWETYDVETPYPDMIGMLDSPLEDQDRRKNEFPEMDVPEAMRKHFKLVRLVQI